MQELTPFISTWPAPSSGHVAISIGYNAVRKEEKQQLVLDYSSVHEKHWRRILTNTITLVAEGLAPPLMEVRNRVFVFEHVTRFNNNNSLPHAWLSPTQIVEEATKLVQRLHDLGYGHGNLNISNLGITEAGKVVLLGLEYVYRLEEDKNASWLRYWMEFYCNCDSYDDFVQGDFKNWKTGALDLI